MNASKRARFNPPESSGEPGTYEDAITCSESNEWKKAIEEELNAHKKNVTWTVMKKNNNMNVIDAKWIFKKKKNEKGEVKKYKARLVARGFNQEYGIDYLETFAPVLKIKSLRLIIALSATTTRRIEQLDVKTAFLNADVHEDIYVLPPVGMNVKNDSVLKLNKALYGIKQAPREWNVNINSFFVRLGYKQCKKDPCIYVRISTRGNIMILGLFVDDIITSYDVRDEQEWNNVKKQMMAQYDLTDIGDVHHILGMRVTRTHENIFIDQETYIHEKLKTFNMSECKGVSTPGDVNVMLNDSSESANANLYRSIVGSLIYASTSTRPDITHAVNVTSRFMHAPTETHMRAAKRILRYLIDSTNYALKYNNQNNNNDTTITAYCDADWGGDKVDRKSTTGYCVYVNDNLISWNTKKQTTVALSTAEAELMAIVEAVRK